MQMPKNVQLKLLELFLNVVEHGGFTPAQAALNINLSTLSSQFAALEDQLGVRLCHRGRPGFRLTNEGEQVYVACQRLLGAVNEFDSTVKVIRGELSGHLSLGIVDNVVTNPACKIQQAIARFKARPNKVDFTLQIGAPDELEVRVVEGRAQLAIGAFQSHSSALSYEPIFEEEQMLLCGREHPLYGSANGRTKLESIQKHDYVARAYDQRQRFGLKISVSAFHMEAIAMMILSGRYLGHLPSHYAAQWIQAGEMCPILPRRFNYNVTFEAAWRRGPHQPKALRIFLEDLRAAHTAWRPKNLS